MDTFSAMEVRGKGKGKKGVSPRPPNKKKSSVMSEKQLELIREKTLNEMTWLDFVSGVAILCVFLTFLFCQDS